MTPEYIEQHEIIERYLAGELSAEQAEEFEARLLWDERVQEQFELTRRLRDGVRDLGNTSVAIPASAARTTSRSTVAMAASLLVALGAGFMLSQALMEPATESIASGNVYQLDQMRGTPDPASLPVVQTADAGAWTTLIAYPAPIAGASLHPVLFRQAVDDDWTVVWRGDSVAQASSEGIAVAVRNELLRPGVYRLSFTTRDEPGGPGTDIYFRVAARAPDR